MRRAILTLSLVLVIGLAALAGAVYINDTGEPAHGFRIAFQSPVTIKSHAGVFPVQEPEGEAAFFTFSGGEVPPGGNFWLSWWPPDIGVVEIDWLTNLDFDASDVECCKLDIVLAASNGQEVSAVVIREKEVQAVPFTVKYTIQTISQSVDRFTWQVNQSPTGVHYKTFPVEKVVANKGEVAEFTFFSNRPTYIIELTVRDGNVCYTWTDVVENIFYTNHAIKLNREGQWEQLFSQDSNSMLYITRQTCEITRKFGIAIARPRWPGNYHFLARTAEGNYEVEAYVLLKPSREIPVRGIFFADYYGLNPPGGRNITESVIREAVEYVRSLNADLVAIKNFCGAVQISPYPLLRIDIGGASISAKMLGSLNAISKRMGLQFYLSIAQYDQFPYLNEVEKREIWSSEGKNRSWYLRLFHEIQRFVSYNARITQELDLDFVSADYAGPLYVGGAFEKYGLNALCDSLIRHMRASFDAQVGWADPYPGHNNAFLKNCDFIIITLSPLRRFNMRTFPDPSNPTVDQIEDATLRYLNKIRAYLPPDVPVFVRILALSEDRQNDFIYREPFPRARMDLQEQVIYLEGFFRAAYMTPWIQGILAWNVNWFPEWALPDWEGTFSNWNFRGKPAEEVVRLWYKSLGMAD